MGKIRILIADDHEVIRTGLVALLAGSDIEVVGQAASGKEAVKLAEQLRPDVVLLDIRMPKIDGVERGPSPLLQGALPSPPAVVEVGFHGAASIGTDQRFVPVAASTATQYSRRGLPLEIWVKAMPLLTANELKPLVKDRLVQTTKLGLLVSHWRAIGSGVVPSRLGPWN